jgi:hypothetical protein
VMMKEDFMDTVIKQWTDEEFLAALEVVEAWYLLEKWRAKK